MTTNRMFAILVVFALAIVTLFTFREAVATQAAASADRSYDQIEQARLGRVQADASYEQVETLRLERSSDSQDSSYQEVEMLRALRATVAADRSYDAIENLRASRGEK
ncbi:MAG TPA: hypothetical protein VMJ64_03935 [Anaerolineales bacterium]|nr:hypothetical protein [Anaerolineales bacterium]